MMVMLRDTEDRWPRPLWNCFQNDTVRMGDPAPDQAGGRHAGELDDAAQLPLVFHRFRAVRRMRNPTQVSAYDTTRASTDVYNHSYLI